MNNNENINIFFASNDKYTQFLSVAIVSILEKTNSPITFYILDSGISDIKKQILFSIIKKYKSSKIEFLNVDISQFKSFNICLHFTFDIYSRLLIPILKPNLNKVIYLDCDLILLDDIKKLYEQNLNGYILGAVEEFRKSDLLLQTKKNLGIEGKLKYFNSGVLLIDVKKWNKNKPNPDAEHTGYYNFG